VCRGTFGMMRGRKFAGMICGALAGILATGAAQAVTIDFDQAGDPSASNLPQSFGPGTFSTNGGTFQFTVPSLSGTGVVDLAAGTAATSLCSTGVCSDSGGTQALYMFDIAGLVRLTSPGNTFSVLGFDAAAASVDDFSVLFNGANAFNSDITLTGQIHGGGIVSTTIQLLAADNFAFINQQLSGFTNLDYLDFAYDPGAIDTNAPGSGDFAIDNINLTTAPVGGTPPPTGIPEPGTLGLVGFGLAGFGWMRRKMKRSAA